MPKLNSKHYIFLAIFLIIFAWCFRYDTHCGGNYGVACVSYDRFTGKWIIPVKEAQKNYRE